ncbi:glutamate--tRNA ligase [bacterium]|nr:glutamate--tRNA ligase [bacterium]MBU1880587.1 glutamate--tRNA ligase [bacterium]
MPDVRVRFAPSPTGSLHVGGARTALFNWLYARHTSGKFVLRIEDTDKKRSTPEAVQVIFDGLKWLNIDWDEAPLFQSERLSAHKDAVAALLQNGSAYRCFCAPETIVADRQAAEKRGEGYSYPRTCLNLNEADIQAKLDAGEPYAVRFKIPEGVTEFNDAVLGLISTPNKDIDDFILLRRDGTPVYMVAVVADDAHQGVTHIIRGEDHTTNTPKQILLYQASGLPVPQFAHIPLILGPDKKRLSKRHGATSVLEYRADGILAEAMRNYLALLGWSPGDDREVMSLDELIAAFDLDRLNKSGAVFDETKLEWMNGQYISTLPIDVIWQNIEPHLTKALTEKNIPLPDAETGLQFAELYRERLRSFREAPQKLLLFFKDPSEYDEKTVRKRWKQDSPDHLRLLQQKLEELPNWDHDRLEELLNSLADRLGLGRSKLIHPLRLALTGGAASPGIFAVMVLLGKDCCLRRIRLALERIK